MKPTLIRIYPLQEELQNNGNLKAYVRVELEGELIIQDIRIIHVSCSGRTFIAFPSRHRGIRCDNPDCLEMRDPGDMYCPACGRRQPSMMSDDMRFTGHRDCCFPKNAAVRDEIETAILHAYSISASHPDLNSFVELWSGSQVYVHRNRSKEIHRDDEGDLRCPRLPISRGSGEDKAIG